MLPLLMTLLTSAAPLSDAEQRQLLEKTQTARLAADLSGLSAAERVAVSRLIDAGQVLQELHEWQLHPSAPAVRNTLAATPGPVRELYRLFQGPIATTLDNQRRPFVEVDPEALGRNVYPWQISRDEVTRFLEARPGARAELLDPRTVVRRADEESIGRDLAALRRHPALRQLHPGLFERLAALGRKPRADWLYAVPYAVAYADELVRVHGLVWEAAEALAGEDAELAGYLRHRARDLLTNDYEAGDASWVTGNFKRLNVQLGAYETYSDELFGQKAFHSLSILLRDDEATGKLAGALGELQALEDALPYQPRKQVRGRIPVGVYEVIADFGQSRSGNTASILPNDERHARRYGRIVLLRANVLRHPGLNQNGKRAWDAVMAPEHHRELVPTGHVERTLWHEIGHYLGPDVDAKGRPLAAALEDAASLFEELKADLVSLYSARALRRGGLYDDATLRHFYASGVFRALNPVRPRREQPYQTMRLMQFNWFLEHGLLESTPAGLRVHYQRYHEVVGKLLTRVLALQQGGDRAAAEAFIQRWSGWDDALHERLAKAIQAQQRFQYTSMRYEALGD